MRLLKRYTIPALLIILAVAGCKKNTYRISAPSTPAGVALVKLAFFSGTSIANPVLGYINGERVTNVLVQPISFPGGGLNMNGSLNADYLQVTPGTLALDFFTPITGTAIASSKYFGTSLTGFEADKRYTIFITDTAANTVAFAINDDVPAIPDSGITKVKFVNAIPGTTDVDLYKGPTLATSVLIKAGVKYKATSEYIDLPSGTDSFFVRTGGAPTTTLPIVRRGFALGSQRIYTMLGRGYAAITTGLSAINLSVIVNQ